MIDDSKSRFTTKETESLEQLKKSVALQAQFLNRFKQISQTTTNKASKKLTSPFSNAQQNKKASNPTSLNLGQSSVIVGQQSTQNTNQARRTLIDR